MKDQDDTFVFSLDMLETNLGSQDMPELLDDDDIRLLACLDDEPDNETDN